VAGAAGRHKGNRREQPRISLGYEPLDSEIGGLNSYHPSELGVTYDRTAIGCSADSPDDNTGRRSVASDTDH